MIMMRKRVRDIEGERESMKEVWVDEIIFIKRYIYSMRFQLK